MSDEDVRLGAFREPQMVRKTQPCVTCGEPVQSVGNRCNRCLRQLWWRETLERQAPLAAQAREVRIVLDKHLRPHIALLDRQLISFCMLTLHSGGRDKRTAPDQLPVGTCEACRKAFERARKGEPPDEQQKAAK